MTHKLCGPISQLILRNRGAGPFGLLNLVDERCGGTFDNIDDVIPPEERTEFMAGYKAAAGFAIEQLNKAPPTIPEGARVRSAETARKTRSRADSVRRSALGFAHGYDRRRARTGYFPSPALGERGRCEQHGRAT